jgi:hypothetical protein
VPVRCQLRLLQVPELAFRDLSLGHGLESELVGLVAVGVRGLTWTTGHGPASITVTGVTTPLSGSKSCVIPNFLPTMPFTLKSTSAGNLKSRLGVNNA